VVEHNRLTYSLVSGPAGATIDPNTGAISWNPTAAQAGSGYTFTIMVSDAGAPPVSATTSFTVIAAGVAVRMRMLVTTAVLNPERETVAE